MVQRLLVVEELGHSGFHRTARQPQSLSQPSLSFRIPSAPFCLCLLSAVWYFDQTLLCSCRSIMFLRLVACSSSGLASWPFSSLLPRVPFSWLAWIWWLWVAYFRSTMNYCRASLPAISDALVWDGNWFRKLFCMGRSPDVLGRSFALPVAFRVMFVLPPTARVRSSTCGSVLLQELPAECRFQSLRKSLQQGSLPRMFPSRDIWREQRQTCLLDGRRASHESLCGSVPGLSASCPLSSVAV